MIFELRTLARAINRHVAYGGPVEVALIQHQLGCEVLNADIRDDMQKKSELRLQRELCKFLLERHIYSVGTKFGQNELDLLAEDPFRVGYMIEVKKYSKPPSRVQLQANLVQLQRYMSQSPVPRLGILVVFNFSSTLITAPRRWFSDRFWILPINMLSASASRLRRSISIDEGPDGQLLSVEIDEPGRSTNRSRRRKSGR